VRFFCNAAATAEIKAIDAPLRQRFATIPEAQRWLVSSEGAFSYLARDYGLKELYLWPIRSEERRVGQEREPRCRSRRSPYH
jgi:manganese/iron transport system substrate-binding protein